MPHSHRQTLQSYKPTKSWGYNMDSLPADQLSDVEISETVEIRTRTVRLKNATPMSILPQTTGRLALLESNVNLKGPDAYKTRSDRSKARKVAWAAIAAHKAVGDLAKANAIARAWGWDQVR